MTKIKGKKFLERLERVENNKCKDRYDIMKVLKCSYPAAGVYLTAIRQKQVLEQIKPTEGGVVSDNAEKAK